GLERAGALRSFLTGFYYGGEGMLSELGRRLAPRAFASWRRVLERRHHPQIPADRVCSVRSVDGAIAVENRLGVKYPEARRAIARWRTRQFDRTLARLLKRWRPQALVVFSDVGSEFALPLCRELGIASILSMVHGDIREECEVLRREAERAPEYLPLYLGDRSLDRAELEWLHSRRRRDLALADLILVPSEHIAGELVRHGTPRERIRIIPYAADTRRFRPRPDKQHDASCTFLFAGGITQRKGIKYLLEAWQRVRRPGWRLQLLGALPPDPGPIGALLDGVELLGRVPHAEVPARMATADVFVFPSLFEGSAVVTYEALASGLPCIVTPSAGSIARDGQEGLIVPPADVEALATAMERLGSDPALRARLAASARRRAEMFDWPRYQAALLDAIRDAIGAGD
ncbi:MAG: glycosyltransferase family 4 protein, partial [Isosphaeraceae bacterium]|nr:glycosyltransferase family 4 protein [Isosphaeraceae bacterium]